MVPSHPYENLDSREREQNGTEHSTFSSSSHVLVYCTVPVVLSIYLKEREVHSALRISVAALEIHKTAHPVTFPFLAVGLILPAARLCPSVVHISH